MSIFAVFQSGGKQYRAKPGDFVQLEKLEGPVGQAVTFDQVVLTAQGGEEGDAAAEIQLGKPLVSGAKVSGEIVGQGRGTKILIVKMKRRKSYRRTKGHRQNYTQVLVTAISAGSQSATLADADKSTLLKKFQSHLKPRVMPVKALQHQVKIAPAASSAPTGSPVNSTAKKTAKPGAKAKAKG